VGYIKIARPYYYKGDIMNFKEEWQYNNITCPENGCRCDPICNPKCDKAEPKFAGTIDDMWGGYIHYTCECKAKWYSRDTAMIDPKYEDDMKPWLIGGLILGSVVGIILNYYLTNGI
jgi:hypothetical protein